MGNLNAVQRLDVTTCPGSQVLWRYKQRVQGSTGSNAAQLSCLQGSTRTFQPKAGVSWELGLRHGVTMHPRGRHLREGRILRSHGKDTTKVREQQPPHQLQHYDQGPIKAGKNFKEVGSVGNFTQGQVNKGSRVKKGIVSNRQSQYKRVHRELCGDRREADRNAQKWKLKLVARRGVVSPARGQSGELYSILGCNS